VYDGKLLATWPERVDPATGLPAAGGVPRIVMAVGTQTTTGISWNNRSAVDLKDPGNAANTRCEQEIPAGGTTSQTQCRPTGAQLMPFLTARNGQVAIVYYESRHQDPDPSGDPGAPGGLAAGTGFISGMQRQVDVRAAVIDPATWTTVSAFQVSRYVIDSHTGRIAEDARPNLDPKLRRKVNYGNFPMYRGGLAPFIGDYLHAIPLRPDGSGPGFRFVFTSNELVTPPLDLDFTKYDKPQQGVLSSCNPGSRNSTIMTAEVGTGLVVGSPGTFKQLVNAASQSLQRAFAVYVENHTNGHRVFRLTFSNVSTGVQASFEQFASVPQVDVEVLASSSIARTVFLSGAVATGSVVVNVTELSEPSHAPTLNQVASLTLNGDATNPFVGGADGNPNLGNTETHTPQLAAPQLGAPQLGAPQLGAPQVSAPQLGATGPADNTITDVTYKVTDAGNTASSYNSLVSLATAPQLAQTGHRFQVLVYRVHRTAAAQGCGVGLAQQDQVIYQTPQLGAPQLGAPNPQAPQLGAPQLGAPQLGAPQLGAPQLAAPQIAAPQLAATSFTVAPADPTPNDHDGTEHEHQANDEVMLTLRIFHPDETEGTVHNSDPAFQTELENGFAVAVQAQAANTGQTTPDSSFLDSIGPDTSIATSPASPSLTGNAVLTFTGSDNLTSPASLLFECSLDAAAYAPCTSPATYSALSAGSHTFAVRAKDQAGNVDASPATATWTVSIPSLVVANGADLQGYASDGTYLGTIGTTTTGCPNTFDISAAGDYYIADPCGTRS
jgi:hypothetical protein